MAETTDDRLRLLIERNPPPPLPPAHTRPIESE